jgi:hypothetical protein
MTFVAKADRRRTLRILVSPSVVVRHRKGSERILIFGAVTTFISSSQVKLSWLT